MLKSDKRNSSIELLKIAAIIMIVLSHAMPFELSSQADCPDYVMNLNNATPSIQRFVITIFRYMGQLGNAVFVVCSSWFLLDSNTASVKKVFHMIADCFIISIAWLLIVLALGYNVSLSDIVGSIMPVTFMRYWFVGCYILLYLAHPLLNIIINTIDKRKLLSVNLVLIILYCGVNFLLPNTYYYTRFVGFICIYFITAYMKKYMTGFRTDKRANYIMLAVSAAFALAMVLLTNFLGMRISIFSGMLQRWNVFINPFFVMISLSMFNLAKSHDFKNKAVNYISGMSLLIYIIHNNRLLMEKIKTSFFGWVYTTYSYSAELLWVVVFGIILFAGSLAAGFVYKATLQKAVVKFCDFVYVPMKKAAGKLIDRLTK